jgi:hypothetical protein
MDFLADLEEIILKRTRTMGIKIDYKEVSELLRKYINVKSKLIDNKPRKVYYSSELQSKMRGTHYYDVLKKIEKKFKNGEDINPHLSIRAFKPNSQDGILNDWGIRHLHLSDTKKKPTDKFYERSDYLLMFIIGNSFVCFLDVRPHSESKRGSKDPLWVRDELLEIIQKNWEKLLEPYEYKGVKPADKYTKEEYLELRRAGIIMDAIIGDKVYFPPGGGVTTAGTGASHSFHANRILNTICGRYRQIKKNPDDIKSLIKKDGIEPPEKLDFKLMDDSKHGLVCVEKNVNWDFPLNINL